MDAGWVGWAWWLLKVKMGGQENTPPPLAHVHIVHKLPLNPEAKLEGKNEDVEVTPLVTG